MELNNDNLKLVEKEIQRIFPNIHIQLPLNKEKKEDYNIAIFLSKKSLTDYIDNYDSEDYIINQINSGEWFFSKSVCYPGVRMRADGTGEPDMWDIEDSEEKFKTWETAILGVVKDYMDSIFDQLLMSIEHDLPQEISSLKEI